MNHLQPPLSNKQPAAAPARGGMRHGQGRLRRVLIAAALLSAVADAAAAYTATLTAASPTTIYLQVGVGGFTADYVNGGSPQKNATVNTVSVTLPTTVVGNGTAQAMTTNSTAANSYWDGYLFCTVPAQLYIGGFYRTSGATTTAAQVTATVPAALTNASGNTLPFSTIQWTSSGNGDTSANGFLPEVFPAGTFVNGGVQTVGSMASNTWNESCWTFSYSNRTVPAAGTYTGAVLYTMTAP
ncbi:MAG: hypothetical protein WBF21_08655 [Steroidobacteraceae bacterium]